MLVFGKYECFSSCRCCMFVSCVHLVAVLNAAFCMTCSLLMLFEDARGDHMEEHSPLGPQLDQLLGLSHHIAYT